MDDSQRARLAVVKKNHVIQEIEHVVETVLDNMVIEKHGEAGKIAVELEAERIPD